MNFIDEVVIDYLSGHSGQTRTNTDYHSGQTRTDKDYHSGQTRTDKELSQWTDKSEQGLHLKMTVFFRKEAYVYKLFQIFFYLLKF